MHLREGLVDTYYNVVKAIVARTPLMGKNPNTISLVAFAVGMISAFFSSSDTAPQEVSYYS